MNPHDIKVGIDTKIVIRDAKTREILRVGKNAIHPQNMSRVIARALAHEPNSLFHRIAFGNGGTYTDAAGNVVFNAPNDGNSGGWEARLYNETYSEIVDELHPDFKTDPGSADVNNVRMAGGASPADDPEGGGVTSVEVGRKSNIVVTVVINENEPSGQMPDQNLGEVVEEDETYFMFDEIGIYAPGKPAKSTSGYSTVNVGTNKTSTDVTNLTPNTNYNLPILVNGISMLAVVRTPASGTGAAGAFTYGDICEGINTGAWLTSGDPIDEAVTVYITDRSGGAYPTILGLQSYGFLTFESKTTGSASTVVLNCSTGDASNFFNILTNGVCGNVNVNNIPGVTAGVANDPVNPENERERLLTHFIFDPVLKSRDRAIEIEYTLTVSVGRTTDSQVVEVTGTPAPSGTPVPTPTPTPTPTPEPVIEELSMRLYRNDGTLFDTNDISSEAPLFVAHYTGGADASLPAFMHLENTTPGVTYRTVIDGWVPNTGLHATQWFEAAGAFAGDYTSTIGKNPFESNVWDTNNGTGTLANGLTTIKATAFADIQAGTVEGTALVKIYDNDTEELLLTEMIKWGYTHD